MANTTAAGTNYYEVLEVAEDAPPHEVHKAYQRAKSTYSSDNPALYSMFSPEEARELLRLIEEAYTVLGNPGLRKSYNEARARGEISADVALVLPSHGAAQASPHAHAPKSASHSVSQSVSQPVSQPMSQPVPQPQHHQPSHAMSSPSFGGSNSAHAASNSMSNTNANNTISTSSMAADRASAANPSQITSEHRQLPDFPMPSSSIEKSMEMPALPNAKSSLPPGMGRTLLSTYKIDENFETELKGAADFDGSLLQRTRLYKNISIDRLSEATRISRSYLMAVETNDYKSLPAAVFTRGFIVQVARVLGLADQKVAASYIKMFRAGGGK